MGRRRVLPAVCDQCTNKGHQDRLISVIWSSISHEDALRRTDVRRSIRARRNVCKTTMREPVRKYPRACIEISLTCFLRNCFSSISQEPLFPAVMGCDKPYPLRHALANGQ